MSTTTLPPAPGTSIAADLQARALAEKARRQAEAAERYRELILRGCDCPLDDVELDEIGRLLDVLELPPGQPDEDLRVLRGLRQLEQRIVLLEPEAEQAQKKLAPLRKREATLAQQLAEVRQQIAAEEVPIIALRKRQDAARLTRFSNGRLFPETRRRRP